jgi:hypothetical protein
MLNSSNNKYQQFIRIVVRSKCDYDSAPSKSLSFLLSNEYSLKCKIGKWPQEEIDKLIYSVNLYGNNNWRKYSDFIETRSPKQCRDKWIYSLQSDLN